MCFGSDSEVTYFLKNEVQNISNDFITCVVLKDTPRFTKDQLGNMIVLKQIILSIDIK